MSEKLGISTSKGFLKSQWITLCEDKQIEGNEEGNLLKIATGVVLDPNKVYIFKLKLLGDQLTFISCGDFGTMSGSSYALSNGDTAMYVNAYLQLTGDGSVYIFSIGGGMRPQPISLYYKELI